MEIKVNGKFYAVGVGPGDFEYMTLKAKRVLEAADVIAVPVKARGEKSTAFEIAKKAVDLSGKAVLELEFPMSRGRDERLKSRRIAAEKIAAVLDEGKTAAMVTLGDASLYSTCSYVGERLIKAGYETETVAGVPSFCAAAARAGVSLCEGTDSLAIVPAVTDVGELNGILKAFGNTVIMKAGKSADKIYDCLDSLGLTQNAVAASEVGMENETVEPLKRDGEYGYFTTIIVKKR